MMTLFRADWYRLRREAIFKIAFFALLGIIVFTACTLKLLSFDGFSDIISQTAGFTQNDAADMLEIQSMLPNNVSEFVPIIMSGNIGCFFFLLFIITIFCKDYSYGTFRNLLSYESGRIRIYLTKLALSICCCMLFNLISILITTLVGGLFFGFGGLSISFFMQQLGCLLLILPTQLAVICLGHCIGAFWQRSGTTIAIYFILLIASTLIVQFLAMIPALDWLRLLDWNAVCKMVYATEPMSYNQILISMGFGSIVAAITCVLGAIQFKRADLT